MEREKSRHSHRSHSRKSSSSSPAVSAVTNGASEQQQPHRSGGEKRNRSRQKSPHPNAKDRGPSSLERCPANSNSLQQCNCNNASSSSVEAVIVHHTTETPPQNEQKTKLSKSKSRSKSRSGSLSLKSSSLKKRVSFDETPVEISSRDASLSSKMVNGQDFEEDIIDEFELPELQEDDLFSTYESLKAHASPSPPPLLSTDLSKEEKKTLGKAKSPPSSSSTPPSASCYPPSMTAKPLATITAIAATKEPSPPQKRPSSHESQSSQPSKPITFRELDVSPLIVSTLKKLSSITMITRCLKIPEKVSFNITSEASYVYILSGQKFIKIPKMLILASF